jgi:hypothetical protein
VRGTRLAYVEQLRSVMRATLSGRASAMFIERLEKLLAEATDAQKLVPVLPRLRAAVRLFVDEQLADELMVKLKEPDAKQSR